ncbi:hypothetical protein SDC9_35049 [bioreactor metagenome]|jgi:trk system potassium uptake protein TrkA|uniref:RCK N-terminal domain-containing protein n=1 Tax=bioreactor metagenome TaxID=1076179 RepID=A0A644VCF9_9ZZZZ|nr:TrkA family potassium uptake protein [Lentimicrobium sp.]MEA5111587.1 TrkA family potassium uptake protein [Lentimicrobium sp.]
MKFIIIGLGNFGSALAMQLTHMGHEVIGVDGSEVKTETFKEVITQTICLDCTNELAMKTLPLRECDYAVVAIGEDFGASVMTTALLKKAGVKRIVSRAIDALHQTVIETIGVDLVMQPEKESAGQLANRLVFSGIRNSFPVASGFRIVEYQLPGRFTGLKLKEVNFVRTYGLQPITIIRNKEEKSLFSKPKQVPEASGLLSGEEVLAAGDILLLFGSDKAIADLAGRDE